MMIRNTDIPYTETDHVLQLDLQYDTDLAIQTIDRFQLVEYRKQIHVGDFVVTYRDAGHILGSATLEIEDTKPNSELKKIVFSGDLGNSPEDLVAATERIDHADVVVMESTYGDRLHPEEDATRLLEKEINAVEQEKSTLLIPAFSLDRTQEILHMIKHLKKDGKVKGETPIYLDGPMAQKATGIYMSYPKLFNDHIQSEMSSDGPFDFPGLHIVKKHEESERLKNSLGPKVIIAGSGMMTGGRIVGHASYFLPQPQNRLFLVGYQGEETLGRQLQEGEKNVLIEEQEIEVRASVSETRSMSSHADQKQLMDWLSDIQGVKKVFLTHGEDGPREVLSKKIQEEIGIQDITMPHLREEVTF
jgi:metallo-beta-lactamase family protein